VSLFSWFDNKVDGLPKLDEDIGIQWYDKTRLEQLNKLIKSLDDMAKDFSANKNALSKIHELEGIYKHLLAFYKTHNGNELDELKKDLPQLNLHAINEKEENLKIFIEQLKHMHDSFSRGFSAYDPLIEGYTVMSSENLALPGCIDFALSNGGLLQSAREAVNYRMMKGKSDFAFYYNTRTAAIYYRENNQYFVAFDDSIFDNILLLRAKEGYDARDNWLVNANDPLVKNAILRAKSAGRTIMVTNENTRANSLAVAKCIIGNKADAYGAFVKKHLNNELKSYVLVNSDCRNVTDGRVLIRLVGLGGVGLGANCRCDYDGRSRGVQKISIGNRGWLVPYIGSIIFQQLGLIRSLDGSGVTAVFAFFDEREKKLLNSKAISVFYSSLAATRKYIKKEEDLLLVSEICLEFAKSLAKHNLESINKFFSIGIPLLENIMQKPGDIHDLAEKFIEFMDCCEGTENQTAKALKNLNPLIKSTGLPVFDEFLIPIAKSQTVATFMILESTSKIYKMGGIQSKKDLELIKYITKTYLTKANVILQDIIIKGLERGIISKPISKDAEIIKVFLENAPAYILELYPAFKKIYMTSDGNARDEKILLLFKDVRQMKKEIFAGTLTKNYDEKILMSVLYFVFACHDMTVPKENYEHTWSERDDRSNDIPRSLSRPISISLSRGSFILKDKNREVDSEAWKLIIAAAEKIKEKKAFNVSEFGFQLIDSLIKNTIKPNRQFFIFGIYQHSMNNGESLPEFKLEHQTLMKYKEFIGDRVANDLVNSILQESMRKNPDFFYDQQMIALGKRKVDFKGLAKQIFGVLNSSQAEDKKKDIILRILVVNGFAIENIDSLKGMDAPGINAWLSQMKPNVIEKGLLAKIFTELYGDDYSKMQEEMSKYEFKKEARIGGGKKYTLLTSKRKAHCLAMYNMGVCVAPDDQLWNDRNFWQLIIFDDDKNAHGGAIIRFIEDNGRNYVVLSIQPSSSILSQTSPNQIFDKIVQAGKVIAGKMNCSGVLIPVSSTIHSNRGSIQGVISSKFKEKDKITLNKEYQFSYSPYSYSYREFYRV
jgi:hypothetical protein